MWHNTVKKIMKPAPLKKEIINNIKKTIKKKFIGGGTEGGVVRIAPHRKLVMERDMFLL